MTNSIRKTNISHVGNIWAHMGRLWVDSHEKYALPCDFQDRDTDTYSAYAHSVVKTYPLYL